MRPLCPSSLSCHMSSLDDLPPGAVIYGGELPGTGRLGEGQGAEG